MDSKPFQISFAPMEGITTYVFRQVHHRHFPGVDRYYTPFLSATQTLHFKKKELRDILPANNEGVTVIPQILGNKAGEVAWAVDAVCRYGYREINFNLGCPMATVAKRGKGAGFLAPPERLDRFFDALFPMIEEQGYELEQATSCHSTSADRGERGGRCRIRFSVKTRIGLHDVQEAEALIPIFNRYPISQLIVHPRLQTELYKGHPHLDVFERFYEESIHPLIYNGDLLTSADCAAMKARFPKLSGLMIGRGLLRDPAMVRSMTVNATPEEISSYLNDLWRAYQEYLKDDAQIVAKMKEIWVYLKYWALSYGVSPEGQMLSDFLSRNTDVRQDPDLWADDPVLDDRKRALKKLFKAHRKDQYEEAFARIFEALRDPKI